MATLLARRESARFAAERMWGIYNEPDISILRCTEEDEREALGVLEKFADQRLSFTDAVSFVLMRRFAIGWAFTFDRHFEQAGFDRWPRPGRPR